VLFRSAQSNIHFQTPATAGVCLVVLEFEASPSWVALHFMMLFSRKMMQCANPMTKEL